MATIFATLFKCVFAISGAMMMQDSTNLFNDQLFSRTCSEAELMVFCTFLLFIVIPQTVEQIKQAKYFCSVSAEYDSIPCNQYLIGIMLPWLVTILISHV